MPYVALSYPRNVTEAVKTPKPEKRRYGPSSPEQAKAFLRAARGDRLEALYMLAVSTGMREGELLGLRWKDIDLEASKLSVQRSLTITKDGPTFTPTKRSKSRRSIKQTTRAVELQVVSSTLLHWEFLWATATGNNRDRSGL